MSMPFTAAAGTINSIAGAITSRKNTKDTIRANKELAAYSYKKDLEQWERSNLYNNPTENMARLKAAGLNPNLVYGTGSATQVAAPSPKYNTPIADYSGNKPIDIGNPVMSVLQATQAQATIENTKAGTEKTNAETAFITGEKTSDVQSQIASRDQKTAKAIEQINAQIKQIGETTKSAAANASIAEINLKIAQSLQEAKSKGYQGSDLIYYKGIMDIGKGDFSTPAALKIIGSIGQEITKVLSWLGGAKLITKYTMRNKR